VDEVAGVQRQRLHGVRRGRRRGVPRRQLRLQGRPRGLPHGPRRQDARRDPEKELLRDVQAMGGLPVLRIRVRRRRGDEDGVVRGAQGSGRRSCRDDAWAWQRREYEVRDRRRVLAQAGLQNPQRRRRCDRGGGRAEADAGWGGSWRRRPDADGGAGDGPSPCAGPGRRLRPHEPLLVMADGDDFITAKHVLSSAVQLD